MKAARWALLLALAVLALAALRDVPRLGDQLPWRLMGDFSDFYCAGFALDAGASPYDYEPLHSCEHRLGATSLLRQNPALVIPAPQPPYDFPPFMLLARMPFPLASAIGALAICLAMIACAVALVSLGLPFDLALLAFAIPVGYQELAAGQIVPFALLALVVSGAALAARRDALAGVCAALVAIEPQFGAFVALAVFCYVPRARWALALTALVMALVAAWTVTPAGVLEYFRAALPAHAGSELNWPFQYSLTSAVHYFGLPSPIAAALGALSSLAMVGLALWISPRLVQTLGRREMFAFFPALCAVVGGTFIHSVEIPAAIPAVLIFAGNLKGRLRAVSACALCLLIVPWIKVWAIKKLFAVSLLLCGLVLFRLGLEPSTAIGILAGLAAIVYAFELSPPRALPTIPQAGYPTGGLASAAWKNFTSRLSGYSVLWFVVKLPTWSALIAALAVAWRCVRDCSISRRI
jgi:hypothetical protein